MSTTSEEILKEPVETWKDPAYLLHKLVPTSIEFNFFRKRGKPNEVERKSWAPCTTPFFGNWKIKLEEGTIAGNLVCQHDCQLGILDSTLSINFLSVCPFCKFADYMYENVSLYESGYSGFVHLLQTALNEGIDYISFRVRVVEYPNCETYCPKLEFCKQVREGVYKYGICTVHFNKDHIRQALEAYSDKTKRKPDFEKSNSSSNWFTKMFDVEVGRLNDPNIKSTYLGLVMQNPETKKWHRFDPKTNTLIDMTEMDSFGNMPIFMIPTQELTPGKVIKYQGKYLWIKKVNSDNTFTGIEPATGAVSTYVISKALINILNVTQFFTEIKTLDIPTLLDNCQNKELDNSLLGAILLSRMTSEDCQDFTEDDFNNVSDDSFDGLGMFVPLLINSGNNANGIIDQKSFIKMMAISSLSKSKENGLVAAILLSGLLSGKMPSNPLIS